MYTYSLSRETKDIVINNLVGIIFKVALNT